MKTKLVSVESAPHYPALDILRALAALYVAIDHGVWFKSMANIEGLSYFNDGVKLMVNGANAVLIFFVISGFCIHRPEQTAYFNIKKFLFRRFFRLTVPLIVASVIAYSVGFRWFEYSFGSTIVWSLLCEEIYYLFYALVVKKMNRKKWQLLFSASFIVAVVLALVGLKHIEYPQRPVIAVVLMGFPIWLMGLLIREHLALKSSFKSFKAAKHWNTILWILVILSCPLTTVLKFKWGISYGISLTLLSPLLGLAIYSQLHRKIEMTLLVRFFSFIGAISYSIYLIHQPLIQVYLKMFKGLGVNGIARDSLMILAITFTILLFYFLIERPSHRLARKISLQ